MDSLREGAARIVRELRLAGHEAYLVGGCVRDMIRGVEPGDYDIATSAKPEEVRALFEHTVPVGEAFGVVLVVEGDRNYEVATFRTEGPYEDGRRPSSGSFATAEEDAKRRDFTVNGLLCDPTSGYVIDYVDGRNDLRAKIIRAIGSGPERFAEDHLRMLRAVRFAANLGFKIEPATLAAVKDNAHSIRRVSAERVRDELTKMLTRGGARRGMELLAGTGLLAEILPELEHMRGCEQSGHPEGDAWVHTLVMLDMLPGTLRSGTGEAGRKLPGTLRSGTGEAGRKLPGTLRSGAGGAGRKLPEHTDARLAWGVLLHDVGKPPTRTVDEAGVHFYGHTSVGEDIVRDLMRRLRFPNAGIDFVAALVRDHMRFLNVTAMRPNRLKRFLRLEHFEMLLELHRLDCAASGGSLEQYDFARDALAELGEEELRPEPLLTGSDLIAMGFAPGPLFGEIIRAVEDAQLDGEIAAPEQAKTFVLARWGDER